MGGAILTKLRIEVKERCIGYDELIPGARPGAVGPAFGSPPVSAILPRLVFLGMVLDAMNAVAEIQEFLLCPTPAAWIERARGELPTLLVDHANCEKKAAGTALNLMFRYVDRIELLNKMSRLAREELRHFEQVLGFMKKRGIAYGPLSSSRYAQSLRARARTSEPGRLIDTLIIGAIIEARSCERFAALAPHLNEPLADFYQSLLKSESRHYQDYLNLARLYAQEDIGARVREFLELEADLISSPDSQFRFHSGAPA